MRILLLRHAPTPWNIERRIQGRTDIGLSESARATLQKTKLPRAWLQQRWITSPLQRARDTAKLLGARDSETHDELTEMHWGQFEGLMLSEINQQIIALGLQPDRGLDLLPPGGESPRMVRDRLALWLKTLAPHDATTIAVTHKGVIRAALSLATGWDMQQPFAEKIDWSLPLAFESDQDSLLKLIAVNCAWADTKILEPASVSC